MRPENDACREIGKGALLRYHGVPRSHERLGFEGERKPNAIRPLRSVERLPAGPLRRRPIRSGRRASFVSRKSTDWRYPLNKRVNPRAIAFPSDASLKLRRETMYKDFTGYEFFQVLVLAVVGTTVFLVLYLRYWATCLTRKLIEIDRRETRK